MYVSTVGEGRLGGRIHDMTRFVVFVIHSVWPEILNGKSFRYFQVVTVASKTFIHEKKFLSDSRPLK